MTLWNYIFGGLAVFLWSAIFLELGRLEGEKHGYERGKSDGWKDCEKCLVDLSDHEEEILEERRKLWRKVG